ISASSSWAEYCSTMGSHASDRPTRYSILTSMMYGLLKAEHTDRAVCRVRRKKSGGSVAEVVELQRHAELMGTQQGNRLLQVIALLAGHPDLLALDGRLHLELGILDMRDDLLGQLLVDALA